MQFDADSHLVDLWSPEENDQFVSTTIAEMQRNFFENDTFQHMICYMCNECSMEVSDPITHILKTFLTSPLTFSLTRTGLVPLKGHNTIVYPYRYMSRGQKFFLHERLEGIEKRALGLVSTQMGGGMVVTLHTRNNKTYLDPVRVIVGFCKTVLGSKNISSLETKKCICDIILQRITGIVNISKGEMDGICSQVRHLAEGTTA